MDAMEKRHIQLKNISFVQTDMKERSLITVTGDKDKAKTLDTINAALPKYITVLNEEIKTGPPENLSKKEKEAWQLKKQSALDAALDLSASYSQHPIDHLREKLNTSGVTEDNTDAFDESVRLIDINPEQLITIHYNIGENDNLLFEYYKQFANKSAKNLSLDEFESAQTQYNGLDIRHGLASPFDQDMNQCTDYKMKFQFMSYIITKRLKNRLMNLSDKQIDITELAKLDTYIMTAGICIGAYIAAKDKQEALIEEENLRLEVIRQKEKWKDATRSDKAHTALHEKIGKFSNNTSLDCGKNLTQEEKLVKSFQDAVDGMEERGVKLNKEALREKFFVHYSKINGLRSPEQLTPEQRELAQRAVESFIRLKFREPLQETDSEFRRDYDSFREEYGRCRVLKQKSYKPLGESSNLQEPLFRSFGSYNSFKSMRDMPDEKYERMLNGLSAHWRIDEFSSQEEIENVKAENTAGLDILREATAAHYDYLFRKYGTGLANLSPSECYKHYEEIREDGDNAQVDGGLVRDAKFFIREDHPEDQLLKARMSYYAMLLGSLISEMSGFALGLPQSELRLITRAGMAPVEAAYKDKLGEGAKNSVNWGEPYYKN